MQNVKINIINYLVDLCFGSLVFCLSVKSLQTVFLAVISTSSEELVGFIFIQTRYSWVGLWYSF